MAKNLTSTGTNFTVDINELIQNVTQFLNASRLYNNEAYLKEKTKLSVDDFVKEYFDFKKEITLKTF